MLISLIIEQVNLLHRSFNQFKMEVKRRYNNEFPVLFSF